MLIYFHIDELARDSIVASSLKRAFESEGHKLFYGNRYLTESRLLKFHKLFDAIILPSLQHFIDTFPDASKLPSNIFILQTEAIAQATGTPRRLQGKYFGSDPVACAPWHKAVSCFLLWGEAHRQPFIDNYPEYVSKTSVVGHPRFSDLCFKHHNKEKNVKKIGFVSRFNFLNPSSGENPFSVIYRGMRYGNNLEHVFEGSMNKDIEDRVYTEVIDYRIMLQIMDSLDEEYELYVRPHPREDRNGWIDLSKKININLNVAEWDQPFGHWIEEIDILVTPPSTGLYDAFFRNKRVLVTHKITPHRRKHLLKQSDDNNQILDGCCTPESVDELVSRISLNDIPYNKEIVDPMLEQQVGSKFAKNSTSNIVDSILSFTSERSTNDSFIFYILLVASFTISYLRKLKFLLLGKEEQGSSFHYSIKRYLWIKNLSSPLIKK